MQSGVGYHVKVVRKDLASEDRRRKRKLKKAILNLQNDDKHRDIDYKMDQHVAQTKQTTANLNLNDEDYEDYDSEINSENPPDHDDAQRNST